jgi:hypothetical protein
MSFSIVLGLRSDIFPLGFPAISLYVFLISRMHATCPAHSILFDLITLTFGYVGTDNHNHKSETQFNVLLSGCQYGELLSAVLLSGCQYGELQ